MGMKERKEVKGGYEGKDEEDVTLSQVNIDDVYI